MAFEIWISMWLSLSVNTVEVGVVDRAHPSGTLTLTVLPGGVNATYAWLSGMSPGGLLSVAAGFGADDAPFAGDAT